MSDPLRAEIVNSTDLTDADWPEGCAWLANCEPCWVLVVMRGDTVVEVLGWDGGEPEDQLLVRNMLTAA